MNVENLFIRWVINYVCELFFFDFKVRQKASACSKKRTGTNTAAHRSKDKHKSLIVMGGVVNFFEQKSTFSSGRRILLSSTAFHTHPLRENLQCSQRFLRCLQKIAQCLQESRQRQMPQKEIRDFIAGDSAYLWQRYALSPAKKRYISKCCVDDITNRQHGFRFIRSIRVPMKSTDGTDYTVFLFPSQ